MNSDWASPEFWVAAVTSIATAVIALLVARSVVTSEEGQLWLQLVAALTAPIAILVLGLISRSYTAHMTQVRVARLTAGFRE
jgi:hypothetical protein